MEKKRVSVQIEGRSYAVITNDDEEYVRRVAQEVGDRILAASRSGKHLEVRDCAILAALDFCDDKIKSEKRSKELITKADQIIRNTNDLNKQVSQYRERLTEAINENTRLTKRVRALEEQLRILSRENEQLRKSPELSKSEREQKFEKSLRDRQTEQLMGYVPMEQGSLFDNEEPEENAQSDAPPAVESSTPANVRHGKKKKKKR